MEQIMQDWKVFAQARHDLRYPKIDLGVNPPYNYNGNLKGLIRLSTFVSNKDKTLLMYVKDEYHYEISDDVFERVDKAKKHFIHKCELTIKKAIFNNESAIPEPIIRINTPKGEMHINRNEAKYISGIDLYNDSKTSKGSL